VTTQKFRELIQEGAFIEHTEFSGNYYGTSFETVRRVEESGRRCILDIEADGVRQIKKTALNPVFLFISPPSMAVLRARLRGRGTDTEASVQKRLSAAIREVEYAKQPHVYDFIIVNDDLDRAYEVCKRVALGDKAEGDELPELDD